MLEFFKKFYSRFREFFTFSLSPSSFY